MIKDTGVFNLLSYKKKRLMHIGKKLYLKERDETKYKVHLPFVFIDKKITCKKTISSFCYSTNLFFL